MSHCGGCTKLGGGAKTGGGPSVYERQRKMVLDWIGRGPLGKVAQDNSWKLASVIAAGLEGLEVDAERVRSEGIAGLSIETLSEWERIYFIERIVSNPDVRRWILLNLTNCVGQHVSPADAATKCDEFWGVVAPSMSITTTSHTCTIAECTTANNNGDGVRYWALLVPEWTWRSEYRPYFYLFRYFLRRIDPTYCEANLVVTNTSGEPCFYVKTTSNPGSIVGRDVVRD